MVYYSLIAGLGVTVISKRYPKVHAANGQEYTRVNIDPDQQSPFQGLVGCQPTNLETGQTSAMWPSRGRCETSIFPNLKRLISGSKKRL